MDLFTVYVIMDYVLHILDIWLIPQFLILDHFFIDG